MWDLWPKWTNIPHRKDCKIKSCCCKNQHKLKEKILTTTTTTVKMSVTTDDRKEQKIHPQKISWVTVGSRGCHDTKFSNIWRKWWYSTQSEIKQLQLLLGRWIFQNNAENSDTQDYIRFNSRTNLADTNWLVCQYYSQSLPLIGKTVFCSTTFSLAMCRCKFLLEHFNKSIQPGTG